MRRSLLSIATCRRLHSRAFSVTPGDFGNVGFIGLGNMGASMARNLLNKKNASSNVFVYDINTASVAKLVSEGAKGASSVGEVAKNCRTIFTMLPATQHVRGTLEGPEGIFAQAQKGSLVVDSSTIDPLASQALIATAQAKGLEMIDAPVSGGVTGAAAGTLTFMVGGSTEALERARPFLAAMGKNIVHCGGPGAGGNRHYPLPLLFSFFSSLLFSQRSPNSAIIWLWPSQWWELQKPWRW